MLSKPSAILVVEDNDEDINLIKRALNKCKFPVSTSVLRTGEAALDFVFCTGPYQERNPADPIHLILLDLSLPKISGLEVLKILKSYARTRAIPTVVLSGSCSDTELTKAYELGVNSYLCKTNSLELLVQQTAFYWLTLNQTAMNTSNAKV